MEELEVTKRVIDNPKIKRVEIEYHDMNYIIANLEENVIDVNGELWEFHIKKDEKQKIIDMISSYKEIDEFDYWPDKTKDHAPISPMWRIAFYDEFDRYFHKSGATHYPEHFMELVQCLKNLR